MYTEKASNLISKLVDANWEIKLHKDAMDEYPSITDWFRDYQPLVDNFHKIKRELIEEMGADEYENFIINGRRMFS